MRALPVALLAGCGGVPAAPLELATRASAAPSAAPSPSNPDEPVKKVLPYPDNHADTTAGDVLFGTRVADPYRWLEDGTDPKVEAWVQAQNALARGELAKLDERSAIAARLKELMYVDTLGVPLHRGGRYFYTRRRADKEKAIVYVKTGKTGEEKALLDPNGWSKDGSVSLGNWVASPDGKKVAYTVHQNNSDEATLHVLDVETGAKSVEDDIEGAKYASASWLRDGTGFYYTWLPTDPAISAADRPGFAEVRLHMLGKPAVKDVVAHAKTGDATKFIGAEVSEDGKLVFLTIHHGWSGNELYFRETREAASAPFRPIATGFSAHYTPLAHDGKIYVATDEGAPRWRVFRVDPNKPGRDAWTEIVKEHPTATIDTTSLLGGKLVLTLMEKASSKLEIRSLDGRLEHDVALPGIGSVGGPVGRENEDEAYFSFESFTTPLEVHALSIKTAKTTLESQVKVPIDRDKFVVDQVSFPSKDGTEVTMFLVHAKDLAKNGDNRTILYGYGGFQVSETPAFAASIFPWLERGGIYAVANLRGGGEYGEAWHQAGMGLHKQNVFDDFIAAAEYLVREKYTRPARLAISGGSNGGLLVGAAMTQRPDLFSAVLCGVPLLDMIRYHRFGSGRTWISEYGSSENEPEMRALFAYSPYHHVVPGTRYPALLLLSADSDDRVDPLHARKFAAAVEDASTGGPVLLRVEKNSGHGGADLRRAEVDKGADRYAFALRYTSGHP